MAQRWSYYWDSIVFFLKICSLEQYLGSLFRQVKKPGRYKVRIMQQEVLNRRCTLFECKHRKILST